MYRDYAVTEDMRVDVRRVLTELRHMEKQVQVDIDIGWSTRLEIIEAMLSQCFILLCVFCCVLLIGLYFAITPLMVCMYVSIFQVEMDKLVIQKKIMSACESCELSASRFEQAKKEVVRGLTG